MRCALNYDSEKSLIDQSVSAWGEMQSLEEEPEYKESDIKDPADKEFLRGYKFACDNICGIIKNVLELPEDDCNDILSCLSGELCMLLFSILDHQPEE